MMMKIIISHFSELDSGAFPFEGEIMSILMPRLRQCALISKSIPIRFVALE